MVHVCDNVREDDWLGDRVELRECDRVHSRLTLRLGDLERLGTVRDRDGVPERVLLAVDVMRGDTVSENDGGETVALSVCVRRDGVNVGE